MKYLLVFSFFILISSDMSAQNNKGVVLKGYIVNIFEDILFVPSTNKDSFINALNDKSFGLGTMQERNDLLGNSFQKVGDSIHIDILSGCNEHDKYGTVLYYFYCEIGLQIGINSNADFDIMDTPVYCLMYNNRWLSLGSIWLRNRVVYLKAANEMFNQQIRSYYINNGFVLPKFID